MTPFADDCRFDVPAISARAITPTTRCNVCGRLALRGPNGLCDPCGERMRASPRFRVELMGEEDSPPYGSPTTYSAAVTLAQKNTIDFGRFFAVRRFENAWDTVGEVVFISEEAS